MERFYDKLFSSYGESILQEVDCGYDEDALDRRLEELPLDQAARQKVGTLLFEYYYRWSINAFTVGLHLGLFLLNHDVRRPGPEKG